MGEPRYFHHNPYYGYYDAQLSFPGYIDFGADHPECGSFRRIELDKTVKEEEEEKPSSGPQPEKENPTTEKEIMINNQEYVDEEPDFTVPEVAGQCNQEPLTTDGEPHGRPSNDDDVVRPVRPLPRKYSPEDLTASQRDPSCKPNWPLASYWPVYVGNFKVEEWAPETWYAQVSDYFAYYGLLTRMIFFHTNENEDGEFSKYQKNCELVDMLVYFTSKDDAERAISTCHHDSYYGYHINVLPGRTPEYFDNTRSVRFVDLAPHYPVEWRMEVFFSSLVPINFIGRYPENDAIVEFETTDGMVTGIGSQIKWKPVPLKQPTMKQRFLEADVAMHIEWAIESDPVFMHRRPCAVVLQQLFEGLYPNVDTPWKGHTKFAKAPLFKLNRRKEKRNLERLREKHRMRAKMPRTEVVRCDPPSQDRPLTRKEARRLQQSNNLKAVNRMLRQHGAAPICKKDVLNN